MPKPHNSIVSVEAERQRTRRSRAEWLYAIANGVVTPLEALDAAGSPAGAPLQNMSLRTLLGAACSRRACDGIIDKLGRTLGCDLSDKYIPIRWLFDGRATAGRRLDVLTALLEGVPEPRGPFGR
jgi:hypothetical protein